MRTKKIILSLSIWVVSLGLSTAQNKAINLEIDFNSAQLESKYLAGLTHTQKSIDSWGNAVAISNAKLLLDSVSHFQNQHLMSWGTLNPWPDSTVIDPSKWNWGSLDARISLIRETKGEAVITLCACPTWMHSPQKNGQTDWNEIENKPTSNHYDDFAHLCAEVARRYPDVQYYQVWNEFKGFYDAAKNRWGYEDYTNMYNMVYDSLKAVNPDLKVGGPYVPIDSWSTASFSHPSSVRGEYGVVDQRALDAVKYWLDNRNGGEFITIDGGNSNKDGVWNTDGFKAAQKFVDVINWIRQQIGGDNLPIWWSEWYNWPEDTDLKDNIAYKNAIMAAGLIKCIMAGYENLMIWQPQGDAQGLSFPMGVWTNTEISGGGQATPFYNTMKGLHNFFSKGTKIYKTAISPTDVISVMASDTAIMLVNQLNEIVDVHITGIEGKVRLQPNEVRFLVDYDIITPVNSLLVPFEFNVYPNPFSDQVKIVSSGVVGQQLRVELFTMNGKLLLSKNKTVLSGQNTTEEIITSNLPEGNYLLRVSHGQFTQSKLLIKAREQ